MDMKPLGSMASRDWRVQGVLLLLLAWLCAGISNGLASRTRQLSWFGRPPVPVRTEPLPDKTPSKTLEQAAPTPRPNTTHESIRDPKTNLKNPPPSNANQPATLPSADPSRHAMDRFPVVPGQLAREIDSEDAQAAFDLKIPFIDARRSAEYELGHVRGAFGISVWESDLQERLVEFDAAGHPTQAPVVIYCSGGDCQDSHLLAARLHGLGYRNLLIYRDGYPDWLAKGRPVSKGAK